MLKHGLKWTLGLSAAVLLALAPAPTAQAEPAVGITTSGSLVKFDTATPQTVTIFPITGLGGGGYTLKALDVRPATGELYALGILDASGGEWGLLYTVDPNTGVVTPSSSAFSNSLNDGTSGWGLDFSPRSDILRLATGSDQNIQLNPNTRQIQQVDTNLDDPSNPESVGGIAYDRNVAGTPLTTLYGIDFNDDWLVRIGGVDGTPSPNTGTVTRIGELGFTNLSNSTLSFDISSTGTAYLASTEGAGGPRLYTVNLGSGAATLIGSMPFALAAFAVLPSPAAPAASAASAGTLPGGGGGPAADKSAPPLALSGSKTQKLGSAIKIRVACGSEDCNVSAKGNLNVPNTSKTFKLKSAQSAIKGGNSTTLRLKLSGKARKAGRRALGRKRKVRASITVSARDAAGNTAAGKRTVKLKG